jgi:hypothetical protein
MELVVSKLGLPLAKALVVGSLSRKVEKNVAPMGREELGKFIGLF